jgi:hypothetical protein
MTLSALDHAGRSLCPRTADVSVYEVARRLQTLLDFPSLPPGRAGVCELERRMFALGGVETELPLKHVFAPGLYSRSMYVPRGTLFTGRIHRREHITILLKGKMDILSPEGVRQLTAPAMFVAPAGTKRAGFAYEDSVLVTVHSTTETDVRVLEETLACDTYEEFDGIVEQG